MPLKDAPVRGLPAQHRGMNTTVMEALPQLPRRSHADGPRESGGYPRISEARRSIAVGIAFSPMSKFSLWCGPGLPAPTIR